MQEILQNYFEFLDYEIIYKRFFDQYFDNPKYDEMLSAIKSKKLSVISTMTGLDEFGYELYDFELKPYNTDFEAQEHNIESDKLLMVSCIERAKLGEFESAKQYIPKIQNRIMRDRTDSTFLKLYFLNR
ncbi:hypothetical protein VCSRO55_0737 [Vibrio cholerae]|uniref:hypothetical protein n=1 Tax=Vibrio cholerae TaxID=666 RepID=UPI0011D3F61A|nr:hypothetical protein [Vibrio cholerae]EGR2497999.1 hypothetical protein [Vibrio cholerae]TXZ57249.1 hypothetical protein FXE54_02920 [Vibrio cholerae]GHW19956.1 hypothetical protein VCSRO55_0737 [Vibrio cholerae]